MDDIYLEQIKKKKKELYKDRQNFQIQKECWEKSFSEQKMRLEQAINFFKEYNQIKEKKMMQLKEEEKKSQIKENYKNKDIKLQIDNLKSLYNIKLKKFTEAKKTFEEEKEKFEQFRADSNNNLDVKKIEIEKKNLELLQLNSEINQRKNEIKTKEMYLKDKYEDYQRIKNIVESKEKSNIQYERDLKLAAERIVKYTKEIIYKENYIEKEKAELLKKSNDVNLRYKYLNTFTYKSPNLMFNNNGINIKTNYDFKNNHNLNEENIEDVQLNYIKNIDMGQYNIKFNANRYINAVKDRIENGKRIYYDKYKVNENKLDIAKERQYIEKCNGGIKK